MKLVKWLERFKFWKWNWKRSTIMDEPVSILLAEFTEVDPENLDQLQIDLERVPDEKKEILRAISEKIKSEAALNYAESERKLREAQRISQQGRTASLIAKREQKRLDKVLSTRMKRSKRRIRSIRRGKLFRNLNASFFGLFQAIGTVIGNNYKPIGLISVSVAVIGLAYYFVGEFWALIALLAVLLFWFALKVPAQSWVRVYQGFTNIAGMVVSKFLGGLKMLWNKTAKHKKTHRPRKSYRTKFASISKRVEAFFAKFVRTIGAIVCSLLFVFGLINDGKSMYYRAIWTLGFVLFWWFIDLGFIGRPARLFFTITFGGLWIASILVHLMR